MAGITQRLVGTEISTDLTQERESIRKLSSLSRGELKLRDSMARGLNGAEETDGSLSFSERVILEIKLRIKELKYGVYLSSNTNSTAAGAIETAMGKVDFLEAAHRIYSRENKDERFWLVEDSEISRKMQRDHFLKATNYPEFRFLQHFPLMVLALLSLFAPLIVAPYYDPEVLDYTFEVLFVLFYVLVSIWLLIYFIATGANFFDGAHEFRSKLLSEAFEPTKPNTHAALLKHLEFLGLGQFFQSPTHLFRLVGFVDGPNHVLMLRKSMRGSSELVEDFIDRFSVPTLVALTVEEFCDIYSGEDLKKSDHWWTSRIISPDENWN